MSERERWIVYPLLFLALGAALRDKIFNLTQSQTVVCESLGANTIDADRIRVRYLAADHIVSGGQAVNPGAPATVSPAQFLQWLKAMGLLREAPAKPAGASPPTPDGAGELPAE